MKSRRFQVDDRIVYRKTKNSVRPGQNARLIAPATNGDGYSYCVDKFWVVASVLPDGTLLARTRRGKIHRLNSGDPNLRHATFLETFFDGVRFPPATVVSVASDS